MTGKARRCTVYRGRDGWRYIVQAGNWRVIDKAEQGFDKKAHVLSRLRRRYPGVEIIER